MQLEQPDVTVNIGCKEEVAMEWLTECVRNTITRADTTLVFVASGEQKHVVSEWVCTHAEETCRKESIRVTHRNSLHFRASNGASIRVCVDIRRAAMTANVDTVFAMFLPNHAIEELMNRIVLPASVAHLIQSAFIFHAGEPSSFPIHAFVGPTPGRLDFARQSQFVRLTRFFYHTGGRVPELEFIEDGKDDDAAALTKCAARE